MKVYNVSYDLRKPGKDYSGLIKELKETYDWWHYLKSTWLLQTAEAPDQIMARLKPHLHTNDSILIIEIRNNSQGWLPRRAWQWINQRIPMTS